MSIRLAALILAASTTVPPIVRRLQPATHAPVPAAAAATPPTPDPLAVDVLDSIDRIAGLGPSLLVWNECERLRAAALAA